MPIHFAHALPADGFLCGERWTDAPGTTALSSVTCTACRQRLAQIPAEVVALRERAEKAERERDVARQGLWEIAGIAGADLDGDATPAALVYPSVEEFATEAVRELRTTCDEAVRGHAAAERELAEAVGLLRRLQEAHGLARDHAGGPDTAAQEWRYGRDALLSRHQETSE